MKKIMAYALSLMILLPLFPRPVRAADEDAPLRWLKTATMDENLNLIADKTGEDDILLELSIANFGKYKLQYFLDSGERRTVEIINNPQQIDLDFTIEKGNEAVNVNQTKTEMQNYFLSMDYSLEVPVWKSYTDVDAFIKADKLHYEIPKIASNKFPGVAFNINNTVFYFKADFNSGKAYVYLDKYMAGHIVPMQYYYKDNLIGELNVLKALKNFRTLPTHVMKNPDNMVENMEPEYIIVPGVANAEKAGSRPGIRLSFEKPKAMNAASWNFDFGEANLLLRDLSALFSLQDLAKQSAQTANMDIKFSLDPAGNQPVTSLPEAGDTAKVILSGNQYQVDIVKKDADLAKAEEIVRWSELAESKIYTAKLDFEPKPNKRVKIDYPSFLPANKFAYTYMAYTLKRADQKEAYLEITPYDVGENVDLEYTILYNKTQPNSDNLDIDNNLWLKHYQRNDNYQSKINIPVPFNDNSSQDYYQIVFRFSSTNIRSQLLNYQADQDRDVPPSMPNIVLVDNLYIVPPAQDAADQSMPSKIQMDLVFDAMEKEELRKALNDPATKVFYELAVNTLPGENADNKYQVIQVYEVSKQGDTFKIDKHPALAGDAWQAGPSQTTPQYVNGYDKLDELFRMEKIVLYQDGKWAKQHKAVYDEENLSYVVTAAGEDERINALAFPGVNYLRMRAYIQKNGKVMRSRQSLPHSFSMSMLIYEIPTANNLRYEPIYNVKTEGSEGIAILWDWNKNKLDFKNYQQAMLDPLGKKAKEIKYVGYISQDRNSLLKIDVEDRQNLLTLTPKANLLESSISVSADELADFRNKKVFYFEVLDRNYEAGNQPGGEFITQIRGLDPNEIYYLRFVVEMKIENEDTSFEDKNRQSTASIILEATTPRLLPEPGENEKMPLAPDNFVVDFVDDQKIQSFAQWQIPDTILENEKNYGFELLNVENQSLAEKLKQNDVPLEALMTGESQDADLQKLLKAEGIHQNNVQAYRVIKMAGDWELEEYDAKTKLWKATDAHLLGIEGRRIKVIDRKNSANRVLYYYVRAVKYNDQKAALSRSVWREAVLTTPELKRPIHLTVDYFSTLNHDPKTERVIYFDVPLPEGVVLHDNYLVQIFVRGEKDADFKETNHSYAGEIVYGSRYLKEAIGAPVNYQRLYYLVYGLKPGKSYDMKVRLEDRTKEKEKNPDGSFHYATSPFSDVVNTRTEFDQAQMDKENRLKEYLEFYHKRAEELKLRPYFDLSDKKEQVYKYRGSYAQGLMTEHAGSLYQLVGESGQAITYYFPAELIQSASDFKVDLKAQLGRQSLVLPEGFVTENDSVELKEVIKKIEEYQGSVKDYAVMMKLMRVKQPVTVDGKKALEPMLSLTLSVVRQTKAEALVDQALLTALDNAINNNKSQLMDALDKELKLGIKPEKLNQILDRIMLEVEKDFASIAQFNYYSVIQGKKDYITHLNRPMKVYLEDSLETQVYFKETNRWQPLRKERDGSVRTQKTGAFVAVKDENAQMISGQTTAKEWEMIGKYQLDKVFTPLELSQNQGVLGEALIRTAARVLGAGDSNDNASYLKNQGIRLPKYQKYDKISRSQAYYLLVQVYAKKKGLDLKQVRITDFHAIEDLKSIPDSWQNTLLVGHHLQLVPLKNGLLKPQDSFLMKDLLQFLSK